MSVVTDEAHAPEKTLYVLHEDVLHCVPIIHRVHPNS